MSSIVTLISSPTCGPASQAVQERIHRITRRAGVQADYILTRPLAQAAVDAPESAALACARARLDDADGVIVVVAQDRPACAERLRSYFALLNRDALRGKTVLPISVSTTTAQSPTRDLALDTLLAGRGACTILPTIIVSEADVCVEHGGTVRLDERVEFHLRQALNALVISIRQPKTGLDYEI
jgi:NAD(P)H-dependent FMN reductase